MKRLSFVLIVTLAICSSAFALASSVTSYAKLIPVKKTHYNRDPRVARHRAHKATKHRAPKHRRHTV
jgi:hypothetical protein